MHQEVNTIKGFAVAVKNSAVSARFELLPRAMVINSAVCANMSSIRGRPQFIRTEKDDGKFIIDSLNHERAGFHCLININEPDSICTMG